MDINLVEKRIMLAKIRQTDEAKKFFSKIGFNYLALGLVNIFFQIIIVNILNLINPLYLNDVSLLSVLSSICTYILPFPIFYLLMKKIEKDTIEKTSVNLRTFICYMGISLTLMWIGNILGLIITTLLSGAIQSEIANPIQELISSSDFWFNLFVISIMAPIFEEIFFRKFLIDRTIKYGPRVSILISAVIFAFFHGNLNQFFYAFLIGGFLAYVYARTGEIIYTIILHLFINIMGSIASLAFSNAILNIQSSVNLADVSVILIYLVIVLSMIFIGILGIMNFKGKIIKKTEIPLKSLFLNYGIICFIGFYIVAMIVQVIC